MVRSRLGGNEVFANLPVGCYLEATPEEGGGCKDYVYAGRDSADLHPPIKSSRGILFGDFGKSTVVQPGQPVWGLLDEPPLGARCNCRSSRSLLALLIGIPLGIYSAVKQYSRFDFTFTTGGLYRLVDADLFLWPDVYPALFGAAQPGAESISRG